MPTLIAMRHAPPNDTSVYCGNDASICPDALDSLGEAIRCLRDHPQTHIFVSPQTRARETAQLLVSQADIHEECFFDSRLRAKDYGQMQGKKKGLYSSPYEKFFDQPPGGESYNDVLLRMLDFLAVPPVPFNRGERFLLLTHDATIKVLVAMCRCDPEVLLNSFSYGSLVDISQAAVNPITKANDLIGAIEATRPKRHVQKLTRSKIDLG